MLNTEIKGDQLEMNQQFKERGGILNFVIVGAVLTILLFGGIMLAKQQARMARGADNPGTAVTETEKPSENKPEETKNNPNNNASGGDNPVAAPGRTNNGTAPNNNNNAADRLPVSGPSEIASAGPEEMLAPLVTLALVTAAVYANRKSQKSLRASALK